MRYGAVGFSIGSKGYIGTGQGYEPSSQPIDFWEYDSGQELLYGHFTGAGIWQWNGSSWSQLTPYYPQMMTSSCSNLYAAFTGYGISKWDGATWTQLTPNEPASMVTGY